MLIAYLADTFVKMTLTILLIAIKDGENEVMEKDA